MMMLTPQTLSSIGLLLYLLLSFSPNVLAQSTTVHLAMLDESHETDMTSVSRVSSCITGNGKAVTQTRALGEFSQIQIDGSFKVSVELQQPNTLTVMGDENLLTSFVTNVKDHTLFVSTQGSICPTVAPEIRVTTTALAQLSADGVVDIRVSHLKNKTFIALLDGSSDLNLSGTSEKLTAILAGANTLQAGKFETLDTTVTIDGAGEAIVNVSRKLIAEINGAGDIVYTGNPSIVERHIHGAGDVESQ